MTSDDEKRIAEIRGRIGYLWTKGDVTWLLDKIDEKDAALRVVSAASESAREVIESLTTKIAKLEKALRRIVHGPNVDCDFEDGAYGGTTCGEVAEEAL